MAIIEGTDSSEWIDGTEEDDRIDGLGGSDTIHGNGGDDDLNAGDDTEYDELYGGAGNDVIRASRSGDRYGYGDGLYGEEGEDRLFGGAGGDFLSGGEGLDRLFGGGGDDALRGGNGGGLLDGGDGDDALRGGSGIDAFRGGAGRDSASFLDLTASQGVVIDLRRQLVLNDGFGNRERLSSIEGTGLGGLYADIFKGNGQDNRIGLYKGDSGFGYGGDDSIAVSTLEDVRAKGGRGNDTLSFFGREERLAEDGTIIVVTPNAGIVADLARDVVCNDGFGFRARIDDFENLAGAQNDDDLRGDDGDNGLEGGSGDNVLYGRGGNDILSARTGNDRLHGGVGDDLLLLFGGEDRMSGGSGADTFRVMSLYPENEFYQIFPELGLIVDFEQRATNASGEAARDLIDLSLVHGARWYPFEQLTFIGTDEFSAIGQVRYAVTDGMTRIEMNLNYNPDVDAVLTLRGEFALTAADFVL